MDLLAELLGESAPLEAVREQIRRLVGHHSGRGRLPSVLLEGETGTGKGLVAKVLHHASARARGPFVDVNCAAIPETLLEAEFFGFERGAFTDARRAKPGLFQTAHGGTLFLDEVGLLPETMQAKLLKAVEERAVRRLGGTEAEPADSWTISATNEDLEGAIRARRFRADLYHRLAVLTLRLPPLRERGQDILLLAERFLRRACADYGLPPRALAPEAQARLLAYPWPGNVRELSNVIERVAVLTEARVVTGDMLGLSRGVVSPPVAPSARATAAAVTLDETLRTHVLTTLEQTDWNISRAAGVLGIARNTLYAHLQRLGLGPSEHLSVPRRSSARRRPASPPAPMPGVAPVPPALPLRWERRHVTFLRATLTGPGKRGTLSGASRALELLIDKVQSFGGHVDELSTTGIEASFRLEDSPRRAAHAALAIQRVAERARAGEATELEVKVGLHVAQVLVGGSHEHVQIEAEAKRVEEPALKRLLELATAGEIVVSHAAAPFLDRQFDLVTMSASEGDPSKNYRLVGRERTGARLWTRQGRFVGRRQERELLETRLAAAVSGDGQVVGLIGGPGVGKSRLAWEFARGHRAPDVLPLETGAASYGKAISYLPVIDLLRAYFEIYDQDTPRDIREKVTGKILTLDEALEPALPALLALLDVPVEDPQWQALDPTQRRQATLQAVKHVLVRQSQVRPLLLVFEDAQWMDSETRALLDTLVDSFPTARALLLVTYRPEFQHTWGSRSFYSQLRVDPLRAEQAEELLHARLGEHPSLQPLKRRLIEWTDGNPFFLEESVRALVETQALTGEPESYRLLKPLPDIEVPATVYAVLAARIDRLPREEKALLHTASAIGKDVPLALLQAIADLPDETLRRALESLRSAEFLYERRLFPDLEYTFKHALTHDVAYGSLLHEHRRALHARIVEAIERLHADRLGGEIERLAHHALRGELREKAVDYLRQAALKATARSALQDARAWFEQALGVLEALPESQATLEQAFEIRLELRPALCQLGEGRRMLERLREAEALAERLNDDRRRGRVYAFMTVTHSLLDEPDEALVTSTRALEIAGRLGDLRLRVLTRTYLENAHYNRGEYERVVELATDNLVALPADWVYEYFGFPAPVSVQARFWLVMSLAELGRFAEAAVHEAEAIRLAEPTQHPYTVGIARYAAGTLHLHKGDWVKARSLFEHGIAMLRTGNVNLLPWAVASSAWALAQLGEAREALNRLRETEQLVERQAAREIVAHLAWAYHALGRASLLLGRLDEAGSLGDRAIESSPRHPGHAAHALHLLGDIAAHPEGFDAERGEAHYRQALALAEPRGMRPLVAHCHLGLGKLHRRAGDPAKAQEHVTTAMAMYREMDMRFWLEQAEATADHG